MTGRPRLRHDLVLVEQTYRGEQSFIVKDPQSRKYFRFRPVEVMVMQALDGAHTTAEVTAALAEEGVKVSPSSVESFARKLSSMGLCERTLGERSVLEMERLRAQRRRRLKPAVFKGDIFRLRWSVGDPDKLFDRWLPRLRFFFTGTFLRISVALFGVYFLVLALKWPEFWRAMSDLYTFNFDLGTFAVLWLTGTAIIIIHELGHGFTCKYFGGQVHEIGAMLIYFEPAFFCNVNDAWTFPELKARLWVTAAGSWIQLVLASVAAIVWWAAAPGTLVSDVAFAAVLIGGITTVFVNVNPLIPLDGYYALSDYLEVPNLRQRAFGYLAWLVKTRIARLDLPAPPADAREQRVFLIYGVLAATYIGLILTFFAATAFGWLSRWFGGLGVALFLAGAFILLRGSIRTVIHTAGLAIRRQRLAWSSRPRQQAVLAGAAGLLLLGAILPWPITIAGSFVVAPVLSIPHAAPDSGVIAQVHVREGTRVIAGLPLVQIRNLELEREVLATRRVTDSLALRSAQSRGHDRVGEQSLIDAARSVEQARLAGLEERLDRLRIRALGHGTVVTTRPEELVGRWVSNGEVVIQLGQADSVEVRIPLKGAGGTLVRPGDRVRLLSEATLANPVSGSIAAVSTAASRAETIEARLRLPGGEGWRPGMTGRSSITLRRSNAWGALWWNIRRGIRSDILL
jgi:multidrug efflux pump subunit AcrA (membrane-fusion protein)